MQSELYFSGKKFISAKRASEITGYTSDYIGQLCRLKKVERRLVGRAWFVGEESVLKHKKNGTLKTPPKPAMPPLRGMPLSALPGVGKDVSKDPSTVAAASSLKPSTHILPASYFSPSSIFDPKPKQETFYISAKRASEITGYAQDYIGQLCRSNQLDCKRVGKRWFISEASLRDHKDAAAKKERGVIHFPPVVLPKAEISATPIETPTSAISSTAVYTATRFKKRALVAGAFSFAIVFIFIVGISFNKNSHLIERTISVSQTENTASVGSAFIDSIGRFVNRVAVGTYHLVADLFGVDSADKIVQSDPHTVPADTASGSDDTGPRMGLTVVPSSGDDAKDEATKQQIKNSFSDQTNVFPDSSGTSGVIKPVFTKLTDQKYLYVMVPLQQ